MNTSVTTLRIDGEMNIYHAAELKQMLLEPLKDGVNMELDLSGVTDIDTAGVQLLMLARKTARENQGELRLVALAAPVREVLEFLNLSARFGDPVPQGGKP